MSDVRLIFSIQAVRAFLYGFSSILIGASLAATGLDAAAVGMVFTAMLLQPAFGCVIDTSRCPSSSICSCRRT